jgi:hypothetical protein
MQGIIDFHTHAFPDALAEKAMEVLLEEGKKMWDVHAHLDGRVSSLITSMDKAGQNRSFLTGSYRFHHFIPMIRNSPNGSDRSKPRDSGELSFIPITRTSLSMITGFFRYMNSCARQI